MRFLMINSKSLGFLSMVLLLTACGSSEETASRGKRSDGCSSSVSSFPVDAPNRGGGEVDEPSSGGDVQIVHDFSERVPTWLVPGGAVLILGTGAVKFLSWAKTRLSAPQTVEEAFRRIQGYKNPAQALKASKRPVWGQFQQDVRDYAQAYSEACNDGISNKSLDSRAQDQFDMGSKKFQVDFLRDGSIMLRRLR